MSGAKDISNLFNRVTALEQDDADSDQSVTRIIKTYQTAGVRLNITTHLHQYRLCGDTQPLYAATTSADHYI